MIKTFLRDNTISVYIIIGLATSIVLSIVLFFTPILFKIVIIDVQGQSYLSAQTIIETSNLQMGQALFTVNSTQVATAIKQNAWVKAVEISKKYPDQIVIHVVERQPIIALPFQKSFVVIAQDGIAIDLRSDFSQINLPVLNGYVPASVVIGEEIMESSMWETLSGIFDNCAAEILMQISEIYWQESETILYLNTGLRIMIGDLNQFDPTRLRMLPDILNEISMQSGEGFLDMRGVNTVYRKVSNE